MAPKRSGLHALRRELRQTLHAQLDALLRGDTTLPDGSLGTILDDVAARQLVGYGVQVSLEVRHPNEINRVIEDAEARRVRSQSEAAYGLIVQ